MGSLRDELRRRLGAPSMDAVFEHTWSCVGTTDALAAYGSFTTALVGGDLPVVVTRDAKGALHGFLNVCRHRDAPVAEGSGQVRVLRCPYHWWIYQLDGRLTNSRGMTELPGFDAADSGLFPVQVATWSRFLFVNLDLEAEPLDPGPLAQAIEPSVW